MRVAVTGASGFIGRHVVRELLKRGVEVVAISRHLPALPTIPAITPLAMDIGDAGPDPFASMGHPDALLHLAWSGLPNYRSNHHLDEELPRHIAFLDACINAGLGRLVVAGTCLEYGLQSGELDEAMPTRPTTAYGEAKHQLHQHLLEQKKSHNFGLGWLRLFYLYGSGQAATSLYPQLRSAVASGSDFDMSGGDQIRDFLAIETAAAYIASLTLDFPDAGTVNVCSGHPATVVDTVNGWLENWDANISLNRGVYSRPDYEPLAFWGSAQRLNSMLRMT